MRIRKLFVLLILMLVFPLTIVSSPADSDLLLQHFSFKEGVTAYDRKAYVAAIENFEKYLEYEDDNKSEQYRMAEYYVAQSYFRLRSKDAFVKLEQYYNDYPYSPNMDVVLFSLGTINYEDQKFQKAIGWFDKINPKKLNEHDKADYFFRKGYAHLQLKQYSKAKAAFNELSGKQTRYEKSATYYLAYCDYVLKNYNSALTGFLALENDEEYRQLVPYYIVQIYYTQEDYDKLIPYAEDVLAKYPNGKNNSEIYRILGECYYRQKKYAQAITSLNKYTKNEKQLVRDDLYMLGVAYYESGDYKNAIENFSKVVNQTDALTQNAYFYLAKSYFSLNDKSNARLSFESASKYNFDKKMQEEALFNFAVITFDLSFSPFSESVIAFEQFLEKFPNSAYTDEVYNYLVNVYLTTKNYDAAYQSIQKIKRDDVQIKEALQRVLYYLGMEDFVVGKYKDAIDKLTQSVLNPYNKQLLSQSYYWRGESYYRLGYYVMAGNDYELLVVTPGSRNTKEYALAHYSLGYVYFSQKDFVNALNWFRKYIDLNENMTPELYADANNRIGDCYFNQRNFKESEKAYSKSIGSGMAVSGVTYAMYQKGLVLGLEKKYQEKIKILESLVMTYPRSDYSDKALFEIAQAYVQLKENRRAIDTYTRIEKLYPKGNIVKKAVLEKGLLYYNMNETDNAQKAFQQVVSSFPESDEAKTALESLEVLFVETNKVNEYSSYLASIGKTSQLEPTKEDSLTFVASELAYMQGGCDKSVGSFENYLTNYPEGRYKVQAHTYLANCYYDKDKDKALLHYEVLAAFAGNSMEEEALSRSAEILYDKEQYDSASGYFKRLYQYTSNEEVKEIARLGLLRCYFLLNDYEKTIEIANEMINGNTKDPNLKREAYYKRMKSFMSLDRWANALKDMEMLAADTRHEYGAESQFLLATYYFDYGYVDRAEKQIFEFVDKGTPYQYWLAKSFLLLSDIYKDRNDYFQAKQYLMSLMNNYTGDEAVLKEAQRKLDAILEKEAGEVIDINNEQ